MSRSVKMNVPSSSAGGYHPPAGTADWRAAGLRYYPLSYRLRQQFGCRVWKVCVDGGFGCPNVDGQVGAGGCVFCNIASFSPARRAPLRSITEQIDDGIRKLKARHKAKRFLAYFQPGTNTHAPVERLRRAFTEALAHPEVAGLVVGTRPDCVPNEILDLLAELSQQTWLSVEFGLQTVHDQSLRWLNRGHTYQDFQDAARRAQNRGLFVGAHVILGLPGETGAHMVATAREVARLQIDSVKLHNLYVAKQTPLAQAWAAGTVRLPDRQQYITYVVDFLEQLHPGCVIDRLSADAPPQYLLAPDWCLDTSLIRRAIEAELRRRDTWQGSNFIGEGIAR